MQEEAVCNASSCFPAYQQFKDNAAWSKKICQQESGPAQLQAVAGQPQEKLYLIWDLGSLLTKGAHSFTARLWDGKSISWAEPQIPISCTLIGAKINGKGRTEEAWWHVRFAWAKSVLSRQEQGRRATDKMGWEGEKRGYSLCAVAEGKPKSGQSSVLSYPRLLFNNRL